MNWTIELEDLVLFGVRLPSPEIDRLLPDDVRPQEFSDRDAPSVRWGFARAVQLSAPRLPFGVTPGHVGWTALPVQHSGGPGYHLSNVYLAGISATFADWLTHLPVRCRTLHLPRRPHPGGRYRWSLGEAPGSYVRARMVDRGGGSPAGDVFPSAGSPWGGAPRSISYGGRQPAREARMSTGDSRVRPLRVEEFELTNLAEDLRRHHPPDLEETGVFLPRLTLEVRAG